MIALFEKKKETDYDIFAGKCDRKYNRLTYLCSEQRDIFWVTAKYKKSLQRIKEITEKYADNTMKN
jgi:hypothetical protein